MSINETNFDFESMKDKALEQLRSGKSLYGKDGAFAPLLKSFLEAALEAEMDSHMDDFERSNGNRRNGKTSKQIRTSVCGLPTTCLILQLFFYSSVGTGL